MNYVEHDTPSHGISLQYGQLDDHIFSSNVKLERSSSNTVSNMINCLYCILPILTNDFQAHIFTFWNPLNPRQNIFTKNRIPLD